MNLAGRGLLLVWTDVDPVAESRFNAWYDRDHARERVETVPGIVRVRRFVAESGTPKYLAAYDMQSPEVMFSEPYLALRRTRDPESRELIPSFRNTLKLIGSIIAGEERAEGSYCALLRPTEEAIVATNDGNERAMAASVLGAMAIEGVVAARIARSDAALLDLTRRFTTRSADRFLDSVLMIEATHAQALDRALQCVTDTPAADWLAQPLITRLCFRYGLHAPAPPVRLQRAQDA